MPDPKLARGLFRQEARSLIPACDAARLDGTIFAADVLMSAPRADRIDRSTYNVALARHAKAVRASPATLHATMERMKFNKSARYVRACLCPMMVGRSRPDGKPYGEMEWGVAIDDMVIDRGVMDIARWLCGGTVTAHFAMRHMERLDHENPRDGLVAGAACIPMALLYRDCQLAAGLRRDPWDIVVPIPGGIAAGGTAKVRCEDLKTPPSNGRRAWNLKPTAPDGLHLVASLRTFVLACDLDGLREETVDDISRWMTANKAALEFSERDRYSMNPGAASAERAELIRSFTPIAAKVRRTFRSWAKIHEGEDHRWSTTAAA